MATAGKLNLTIVQGATYRKTLTWKDSDLVLIDLTGYTARMKARDAVGAVAELLDLTTENGGITLGGALGTIELFISDTATGALTWSRAVYDLELEDAGGDVTRLVEGTVRVNPEITKA